MKSLITGGSGFLGTNLTKVLLGKGEDVKIYDLVKPVPELSKNIEFIRGDILDSEKINEACKDVDFVYHIAALVPLSKAGRRFNKVNVKGTDNVAEASFKNNVEKFIHVSSSAVYDLGKMPVTEESPIKPIDDYAKSKYEAELVINKWEERGLKGVAIRPRTIVDENRAGIFQILYDWVYSGKTIYVLGSGKNLFQMISASDLCEAFYAAAKSKKSTGEVINIGNDKYGTMNELIEDLIKHAGTSSKIKHVNAFFARNMLKSLDKMKLSPLSELHYLTLDKSFYFDTTKAKKILKWKPKDSNGDMIKRSYDWYVEHKEEVDSQKGTTHRSSPKQKLLLLLKKIS